MANGRLGCGTYNIFITEKCGGRRICDLNFISSINYNRIIDEISSATISVATGGQQGDSCCRCLSDVEPWCHELHILRDGVEVWTGPITRMTYGYEFVTIEASDMLAWTAVRQMPVNINYTGLASSVPGNTPYDYNFSSGLLTFNNPAPLIDIAESVIKSGFLSDIQGGSGKFDDPCILDYITKVDPCINLSTQVRTCPGDPTNRFIGAFEKTPFEALQELSEGQLNFTVVGRQIVLVSNPNLTIGSLSAIGVLQDEHIMGENVQIIKEGNNFATGWFARWPGDDETANCTPNPTPCPAFAGFTSQTDYVGNDPPPKPENALCYPRVERMIEVPNLELVGPDVAVEIAKQIAKDYFDAGFPLSREIVFPPGTRLSPDAPFEMNDLIPSIKVNVILTRSCLFVAQAFRLQEVTVSVDSNGDEEVGITLSDFNTISSTI